MASKFLEDEPVIAASLAGSVVNAVLSVLVTHGIITGTQASTDVKTLAPLVATGLTMLFGVLVRQLVTPAKKVEHLLATSGLLSDVDLGAIDAVIAKYSGGNTTPAPVPSDAVPDGLSAGAPAAAAPAVTPPPAVPPTPTA